MIKMPVSELKPGMKLAKDVHLNDGRLLLLSGFMVKNLYIQKLENFNVPFVEVEDLLCSEETEAIEEKIYAEAFNSIKIVMSSIREGEDIDISPVKQTVNDIIPRVINNEYVFMQLTGIRDIDNYTFLHSVDVCIYSIIVGKSLGLSSDQLLDLGIGAMLHDIGKCKVPQEILLKPGKLTDEEFEIMKLHSLYGYEILTNIHGLNSVAANIACRHHEKWDGSGYPYNLSGDEIDIYSRIVTVSDIYDALTADRVYKKRILPHIAAEYIMSCSSSLLDPDIVSAFIRNIAIYPNDMIVILNNGELGRVVESERFSLRPKVQIIAKKSGPPFFRPYIRDLSKNLDIFVEDILD